MSSSGVRVSSREHISRMFFNENANALGELLDGSFRSYRTAFAEKDVVHVSDIDRAAGSLNVQREDIENFIHGFSAAEHAQHAESTKCGDKCVCLRDMYLQRKEEYHTIRAKVSKLSSVAKSGSSVPKRKTTASYK